MTNAIYEAGFGSSSRAYEGAQLGMTPSAVCRGRQGRADRLGYGMFAVWLGCCGLRRSAGCAGWLLQAPQPRPKPVCARSFRRPSCGAIHRSRRLVDDGGGQCARAAKNRLARRRPLTRRLDLRGTVFQLRVWQALRAIPRGETRSYSELARKWATAKRHGRWRAPAPSTAFRC